MEHERKFNTTPQHAPQKANEHRSASFEMLRGRDASRTPLKTVNRPSLHAYSTQASQTLKESTPIPPPLPEPQPAISPHFATYEHVATAGLRKQPSTISATFAAFSPDWTLRPGVEARDLSKQQVRTLTTFGCSAGLRRTRHQAKSCGRGARWSTLRMHMHSQSADVFRSLAPLPLLVPGKAGVREGA